MESIKLADFEEFKGYRRRNDQASPVITIHKTGSFSLNETAYNAIGRPKFVTLLKHKDFPIFGIQPADSLTETSIAIKQTGNLSKSYSIQNRTFSTYHQINTDYTKRYKASIQEGILLVDLEAYTPVISNRKKKSKDQ